MLYCGTLGILWDTDTLWHTVEYLSTLWYTMVDCGILWYTPLPCVDAFLVIVLALLPADQEPGAARPDCIATHAF